MKSYFIGSLALLAISLNSCSSDNSFEQQLDDTSSKAMTFVVSQEPLTRVREINSVSELNDFYLWSQTGGKLYFKDLFTKKRGSESDFGNSNSYDWPENSTASVDFYATNGVNNFSYIDYIDDHTLSIYNEEVMWFDFIFAYRHYNSTPADGKVVLNFHHVLAELGIQVKGEVPTDYPNAEYNVYSIDVEGPSTKNLHLDRLDETNSWSDEDNVTMQSLNYYYGDFNASTSEYQALNFTPTATTDPKDSYMFLIPDTYTIKVDYMSMDPNTKTGGRTKKECRVTLSQKNVNVIKITLPFYIDPQ